MVIKIRECLPLGVGGWAGSEITGKGEQENFLR